VLDPLAEVLQMPDPDRYGPLVESILVQILYHRIMYSSVGSLGESDPMIHQISEYIDRHIHDRITLDDIARHLYLSKSTLCHVFRRKMNISVKQYILQKKIVYAADLIRNKMPAKEAARSIGYDNYANFYKMYKKFFSETPARRDR
jgi:AraC-like DNA-binding protein